MDKTIAAVKIFNEWLQNPLKCPTGIYEVSIKDDRIIFQGSGLGFPKEWYKSHKFATQIATQIGDQIIYIIDDIYLE